MEKSCAEKKFKGTQMCPFIFLLTDPSILFLTLQFFLLFFFFSVFGAQKDTNQKNLLYLQNNVTTH